MTLLPLAVLVLMSVPVPFVWRHEKRLWNGGVCPQTGGRWELRDHSSQGCRLYRSGEHTIWVSWPVDR